MPTASLRKREKDLRAPFKRCYLALMKKSSDILYAVEQTQSQFMSTLILGFLGFVSLWVVADLDKPWAQMESEEKFWQLAFLALLVACVFFGFRAIFRVMTSLDALIYEIKWGTIGNLLKQEEAEDHIENRELIRRINRRETEEQRRRKEATTSHLDDDEAD